MVTLQTSQGTIPQKVKAEARAKAKGRVKVKAKARHIHSVEIVINIIHMQINILDAITLTNLGKHLAETCKEMHKQMNDSWLHEPRAYKVRMWLYATDATM